MAWARITGPLEIARDHMGLNLFFVEIPRTRLGPTLRSKLLRSPESVRTSGGADGSRQEDVALVRVRV